MTTTSWRISAMTKREALINGWTQQPDSEVTWDLGVVEEACARSIWFGLCTYDALTDVTLLKQTTTGWSKHDPH